MPGQDDRFGETIGAYQVDSTPSDANSTASTRGLAVPSRGAAAQVVR